MKNYLIMENNEWLNYCINQIPLLKARWKQRMHTELNLENPKTFTEKIQYLKIFDSNDLKCKCSDKLEVRDFCKNIFNKDYFINVLYTYDNFEDINFSLLPDNYVIKTNHGSHTNIIVKNGNIDIKNAREKINEWMSKDWTWYGYEMAYKNIKRKIFIEEYKSDGNDTLIDYKFLCFNGVPKYCQVIGNRNKFNKYLNYYDMSFKPCIDISRNDFPANYNINVCKPKTFDKMIETATILSGYFNFVRVDFYEINDTMYLSELTFFPGSGFIQYKSKNTDLFFGNLLKI